MRNRILLFCSLLGCFFSSLSQTRTPHIKQHIISPDSLRGFDERAVRLNAIYEGVSGDEMEVAVRHAQINHIINTYYPDAYNPANYKTGPAQVFNAPCVNEGFESGTFAGWTTTQGTNTNSCAYPTATTALGAGPTLTVLNTPLVDPVTAVVIPNSPLGGSKVAKLNDISAGGKVIKMTQNFLVTNQNYVYDFAYYAVQNGPHNCCNQPYMFVRLRDCIGNLLACPNFTFNAPATNSNACVGTGPTSWVNTGIGCGGGACVWRTNGWQKYSVDLTQYIGTCVTIEVMVGDCAFTVHYLYAYFDSNCNTMNLTVNGTQTVSMPTQTVDVQVPCATTATLTAPGGLSPWTWNGPPLSGVTNNTNQTISTSIPGDYTLVMNPVGICNPIFRIVRLWFAPPATVAASPTNICGIGSSTLTASGATNYTWSPGGSNSPSIVVSPTITSIYTVTANSGTCTGFFTVQVTVSPPASVTITASSTSVCVNQPATLTASGAQTYTWSPGGSNSPSIVVTPSVTTSYTVVGTTSTGCIISSSITINVVPTPTNFVTFASPSVICIGQSSNLFASALGASSYTWNPGALVGNFVSVSPSVTTNYTVVAANGGCTNSAVQQVSVDPGPTMTVVASPTSICPGNSATLSASGAVAYTWNPGPVTGSAVVVSPTITTTYTVTGVTGLGCPGSATVTEVVSPVPNITITPVSPSICVGTSGTLTASGASSYTWNPGGMVGATVVVNPTVNTTYTIIGSNGTCTSSVVKTLTVVPNPTVTASASSPSICSGQSATLTGGGATTYTWSPGALTGSAVIVSPTVTTNYTVIGNTAGCSSNATVGLTVNYGPTLTANASPTNICAGGSATLTVSGGLTYTWNPGALTGSAVVVSPAVTTVYSVTGINGFGCPTTNTVNLNVTPNPTVIASASSPSICIGSSATLTANGATTYTWNPGALTGSNIVVSPTVSTTYTVTGTTAGCTGQTTININVVPIPTVSAASSPTVICSGNSATLTANGATSYTWNPGALTGSAVVISPTTSTTYTVIGNTAGCSSNATVALIVNPVPTITANASPTAICVAGSVTLTATGAVTYTWNPGALTGSNIVVAPIVTTTYTVSGTSGAGCTGSTAITVTVNTIPVLTLAATPTAICIGQSSTLTAQGATSYTWNPGALTGSNVVVSPTVTTIYTINASNGACSNTGTLALIVNPVPTLTATANPTNICAGSSATLTGSGALTYTWNPGALTGATVSVSPSVTTTYTLTGANVFNCTSTQTVNLVVTPLPTITANASPTAICIGGSSTLTATGAGSYTWNPGALTGSNVVVSPTATTIYTVTGSNGNCTGTQTLNLIVNPLPTLTTGASPNPVCFGASVTLTVSGANTYTWNPGALTGSNIVVSPTVNTTYTVTGTSLAGCVNTAVTVVTVNPLPTLSVTSSNTNICAGTNATLTGSGALTYTWNPGALTGSAVVVSPAVTTVYTLTATSALGCTNSITFTQVVTPNPTVTASASPTAICIGGSSTLTASGATSYTWNPGALTGSAIVVSPTTTTTYSIIGANGACTGNQTVTLIVNPAPTLTVGGSPNPVCAGSPVTMTISGASTYTWNPGALTGSNVVVSPTTSTSYSVMGTSVSGCTAATVLNVTVNPLPTLSVSSTNSNVCAGTSVTLTASGGVSYIWNPGGIPGSTIAVTPTATTVYTVSGTSGFGCLNTITFTQVASPIPTVVANASLSSICLGQSSNLTAGGATSYTWNPGALTGSNIVVSPTVSTVYTVTGANGNCVGTTTVSVTVNPTPTITANASPSAICNGSSATLTANGGNTYTWNPGAMTGSNIVVTPTTNTSYTVTGTNGFGCTATAVVNVTVNAVPSISIAGTATNICIGSSATLTGSGGTSYTWNPGALTGTSVVVSPTSTTVYTVTGSNGFCSSTAQFTLLVTPSPTVIASTSNSLICSGNSVTLTSNGAASYTWNPGALTGSNVVVSPTVTTNYTVTGSNGACTSSAVVSVTVNSSPNLTVSASPTLICSGTTVTLTASGAIIYAWLPMAVNGATVTDQPTVTTTYTVVGSNGTCTNAAFVTVSVNTTPTLNIAASPTAVCFGNSSTLTATGAANYTWSPGALTGSNIVVNPTVTTTYTITGTNGNCSSSATINVVVNPNPTITVNATPTLVCSGSPASLTASGAASYTWMPGALTGSLVTVNPTTTTVYTVSGSDVNGCTDMASITLSVNMGPTLTAAASPSSVCLGSSVTMTVSGAAGYTWNPGALTGSNIVVNPTVTTTYTVTGVDLTGCTSSQTVQLIVLPTPTVTASSSPTAICSGNSATLTGSGALTYTWNPGALTGSAIVVNPTVTTSYTVNGSNGLCGSGSTVITVVVNDPPANVTASVSGQISCATPSVNLFSSSTTTTVLYLWNGPGTYTAAAQNPAGIGIPGTYTVTITNTNGGCNTTATVAVTTDSTVPTITASITGTITCANTSATLSATGSPTNAGYSWTGPAPFTSTAQTFTVGTGGSYTLTVTDLNNSCSASTVITVVTDTNVPITASITPATCNGTVANNDAAIKANGFGPADKYDFNAGATYTGTATYATATLIPVGGVLTNTLSNPLSPTPYTVRFFAANGCTKDTTLMLIPTTCMTNTVFGIAKAVSTPTLKPDNTYDVIYSVVIANTGTMALNNIVLNENLSNTFPPPTTFSIVSSPSIASISSSLVLDGTFDGTVQTVMTNTLSSILPAGKADTIVFKLNIKPNGFFGPFRNTVTGFASPTVGVVFGDSSNTGFDPDPDHDGIPTNNNQQTVLNLTPNLFFGLTKKATVSDKLTDNTYSISYTVTVHNLGNDTLHNVMVKDSLFGNTVRLPASYTVTGAPVTSGSLAANSSFNGNSDVNLVIASQSKMAPGILSTIQFTINVTPDTVTVYRNRAIGRAFSSQSVMVSDTSNTGDNPDTNDNGICNETVDNMPTIITIPNTTFFIPNGFSPDGDNINDTWKISGLPSNNKLTVFNRWGNKVYQKSDYDNSWNGYPNVTGTLGNQKLPAGTYYYIIEFSDSSTKAMNGFVVIQY